MEAELSRRLECAICHEPYQDARLLPCLHTFCANCLVRLLQGSTIQCPLVRLTHLLPNSGVVGFPKNFIAQDLVDFLARSAGNKSLTCDFCEDCPDPVKFRCTTCGQLLCKVGSVSHQRWRNTSAHIQEPFDGSSGDESTIKSALRERHKAICLDHPDQPLKFFCESEGCDRPICNDCGLVEHKNHQYGHLAKVGQKHIGVLTTLLGETRVHLEAQRNAVTVIEKLQADLNARKALLQESVEKSMQEVITAVEARKSVLISELNSTYENKHAALQAQKQSIETALNVSEQSATFADEVLSSCRTVDLLNLKRALMARLTEIKLQQVELEPLESVGMDINMDVSDALKAVRRCGRSLQVASDVEGISSSGTGVPKQSVIKSDAPMLSLSPHVSSPRSSLNEASGASTQPGTRILQNNFNPENVCMELRQIVMRIINLAERGKFAVGKSDDVDNLVAVLYALYSHGVKKKNTSLLLSRARYLPWDVLEMSHSHNPKTKLGLCVAIAMHAAPSAMGLESLSASGKLEELKHLKFAACICFGLENQAMTDFLSLLWSDEEIMKTCYEESALMVQQTIREQVIGILTPLDACKFSDLTMT